MAYVLLGTATLSLDEGGVDYWQHLAAVRALSSNLTAPPPLYFNESYEVHLYTPYHLFWAAVRAVSGAGVWKLLILMGTANAILFVVGARFLARYLLRDPELDLAALVVFLTFWGRPVWWSGVYSLGQLALQAMYPSFFGLAVSMIVAAIWMDERFRGLPWLLGFTVTVAFVFATHPVTASFLLVFLASKTIAMFRLDWRKILITGVVLAGGLVLGALWPYYSLPKLMVAAQGPSDFFGDFGVFYRDVTKRVGPELLGLLALPLVADRRLRGFLTIMLAATLTIYGVNYLLELSHVLSRYLIFVTFTLHISVVAALAAVRDRRWSVIVIAVCLITAGTAGLEQLRIAARYTYGLVQDVRQGVQVGTHSVKNRYRDLAGFYGPEDGKSRTLMAPLEWAYRVAALTDYRVVGVMHRAPTMPNFDGRRSDVNVFYDPDTSEFTRDEILLRWAVDYVLVPKGTALEKKLVDAGWAPVHEGDYFVLHSVPRADGRSP